MLTIVQIGGTTELRYPRRKSRMAYAPYATEACALLLYCRSQLFGLSPPPTQWGQQVLLTTASPGSEAFTYERPDTSTSTITMPDNEHSSLVSSHKSPDSGLQIHLHPLVLLTVSDHITRHTLRRREEPIVGALLGQQNGRDITLEHAFECQVVQGEHDGAVLLHQTWFQDRLQQYKDVHKEPALELVGWFTTAPMTGPEPQHVPIHQQIIHDYNETAVLLAFHPTDVLAGASQSGRLPLTIYESVYETVGKAGTSDGEGDRSMDLDAPEGPLEMRFRELPYSVETGEAEMIGVDFVARGGGNATNIDTPTKQKGKEKSSKSQQAEAKTLNEASVLSPEDEERKYFPRNTHTKVHGLTQRNALQSSPPSPPVPTPSKCYTRASSF